MFGTCCVTSWRVCYTNWILMHFIFVPKSVQVQGLKERFGLVKKPWRVGFALKKKPTQMMMNTWLILFRQELF